MTLKSLSDREKLIIEKKLGLKGEKPWTLDETGKFFRLTREKIRLIQQKSIAKLKNSKKLIDYAQKV